MVPYKSTAKEVSFDWSHHRISSTDPKVKAAQNVSIIDSKSDIVNRRAAKQFKVHFGIFKNDSRFPSNALRTFGCEQTSYALIL